MLLLTNKTIDKIKYDLVRYGLVELESLNKAEERAINNLTNLSEELIKDNIISEQDLLNFIQDRLHIPYVELSDYKPDVSCLHYISKADAQKYNIFPLFKIEDVLTIAMSDPLDLFAINNLFDYETISVEPVVCAEKSIREAIGLYYVDNYAPDKLSWQTRLLTSNPSEETLNAVIADIIRDAIELNEKNVYMEKSQKGIKVSYQNKVQGIIPNILSSSFINVLFENFEGILQADTNFPQNTKFNFRYKNSNYPIIISVLPTKFGTRIALEINFPPDKLSEKIKDSVKLILEAPALVGISKDVSGEFVYSLAEFIAEKKSVLFVENLVKYELENVVQIEVNKNTGLYFDEIIKQIEFQKFDVIFFEKIYTKEQFETLKLISKEKTIFTKLVNEDSSFFDYYVESDEKIS